LDVHWVARLCRRTISHAISLNVYLTLNRLADAEQDRFSIKKIRSLNIVGLVEFER